MLCVFSLAGKVDLPRFYVISASSSAGVGGVCRLTHSRTFLLWGRRFGKLVLASPPPLTSSSPGEKRLNLIGVFGMGDRQAGLPTPAGPGSGAQR